MGMFDWYEPQQLQVCSRCRTVLDSWQGKDGPCCLFVFRQGVAGARATVLDGEAQQRLPDQIEIYSTCSKCGLWVDATGSCEDGVWTGLLPGRAGTPTVTAKELSPGWRQCTACAEAWEAPVAEEWQLCPGCHARTRFDSVRSPSVAVDSEVAAVARQLKEEGFVVRPRPFFAPGGLVAHSAPVHDGEIRVVERAVYLYRAGGDLVARVAHHGGQQWIQKAETSEGLLRAARQALALADRAPEGWEPVE